jgi:hypothetical protein
MAINFTNIKTQFKSILDTANTSTAAYDLSTSLTRRVQKVLTVNPLKIPIQPSFFPYVTIYPDVKTVESVSMGIDQLTPKRMGSCGFSVVGAVWQQNISNVTDDPSDNECEQLMENVEEVIRRNFKLNGSVKWSKPERVSYHTLALDEETHMRVGLMELTCKVEY